MNFIRSWRAIATAFVLSMLAAVGIAAPAEQESQAAKPPEQQLPGKDIFEQHCSTCHGLDAGGVTGPNIQGIPFRIGSDPVKSTIKDGVSGAMPAFAGQLDDTQIQQIVDYLLTLIRKDNSPVTGDPAKGKNVYDASGCASCHIIAGEGNDSGPELTTVGSLRGPSYLRNAVLYPGSDLPQAHVFVETGGRLDYLFVHVVTKDGHSFDGTRVVEDSFHIVIKDVNGNFHSFRKSDLKEFEKESGKSVMPSFKGKLSDEQLNDLVAYLASLKEAQP